MATTATVNGVDLGPSTNDPSLGQTFLATADQSTIEYGGSYRWHVDETYIKVNGVWRTLHRARKDIDGVESTDYRRK